MSELFPILAPGEGDRSASGTSGSKANRFMQCLGSTVLPSAQDAEPNEPAERGKVIHDFFASAANLVVELGFERGREAALDLMPDEYREICAAFDLQRLPTVNADRYSHEVAMAYDALEDKARIIGYDIGRNYGELADGEIPFTIDVLGLTDEAVVDVDYKSGRVEVPAPKLNWQLKLGAVAAARRFERRKAIVGIAHARPGMRPYTEYAEFDAFDLDEIADQLREMVLARKQLVASFRARGFAGLGSSLVRGAECRYCPSHVFCPAQTSHIRAVLGDPLAFQRETLSMISAEELGLAKVALSELKGHLEVLEEQLKSCVTERPAVMPSGRYYGPVQMPDQELDALAVHRALGHWFVDLAEKDTDVAREMMEVAVEATTSKAAIERALKKVAPRGALAGLVREAMKRIEAAGGIKTGIKTIYREHNGQPKALAVRGES